ncbi:hypothetical protein F53441_1859 [Fusarium austroafricanum]|uniref:Uncharacterized protein n=1 Tax=Fusarium austroafricanum TaxID=2364996 RepID=A0A8H4KTM2_9HYPO|nr:hypothetical protein F53441_1859 [Fusarium austroafricanum]
MFKPSTSEQVSRRTIDRLAVNALAPSSDCQTFAIGGLPHVVNLPRHASSSRQKDDMLAVHMREGDLPVWSMARQYNADNPATVPWDGKPKHVTYDPIPTLDVAHGLAAYGRGDTLFTLGLDNTVHPFDPNPQVVMIANVQHPAKLLPPSPPASKETCDLSATSAANMATESEASSIPLDMNISKSDEDHPSPFARLTRRQVSAQVMYQTEVGSRPCQSPQQDPQAPCHYQGQKRTEGLSEYTLESEIWVPNNCQNSTLVFPLTWWFKSFKMTSISC